MANATLRGRLARIEREVAELEAKDAAERDKLCREYGTLLTAETDEDQERLIQILKLLRKSPADVKTDLEIIQKADEIKRQLVGMDAALQEAREATQASRDAADAAQQAIQASRDAESRRLGANNRYNRLLRLEADRGALMAKHPDLFPNKPAKASTNTSTDATPPAAQPPTAGKKKVRRVRLTSP
jgi:hypothetical protein